MSVPINSKTTWNSINWSVSKQNKNEFSNVFRRCSKKIEGKKELDKEETTHWLPVNINMVPQCQSVTHHLVLTSACSSISSGQCHFENTRVKRPTKDTYIYLCTNYSAVPASPNMKILRSLYELGCIPTQCYMLILCIFPCVCQYLLAHFIRLSV